MEEILNNAGTDIEYHSIIVEWENEKTGDSGKTSLLYVFPDFRKLKTFLKIKGGGTVIKSIHRFDVGYSLKQKEPMKKEDLPDWIPWKEK